ncbi:MAG: 30S ribosomal protein S6 [Patescibacteria group bacterium]|nr:30S ribosomal protein S6 [Patescibacteria group bacterium]
MKYELTLLLKNEEDLEEVKKIVSSFNGKIEKEEKWGERLLAYPIEKKKKAFYFSLLVSLDKNQNQKLKQKLNFEPRIIRYLMLSISKNNHGQ